MRTQVVDGTEIEVESNHRIMGDESWEIFLGLA